MKRLFTVYLVCMSAYCVSAEREVTTSDAKQFTLSPNLIASSDYLKKNKNVQRLDFSFSEMNLVKEIVDKILETEEYKNACVLESTVKEQFKVWQEKERGKKPKKRFDTRLRFGDHGGHLFQTNLDKQVKACVERDAAGLQAPRQTELPGYGSPLPERAPL